MCTASRVQRRFIVSPDVGNVKVANAYASALDADLAIIDKRRPKANEAQVMNLIGDLMYTVVDPRIDFESRDS